MIDTRSTKGFKAINFLCLIRNFKSMKKYLNYVGIDVSKTKLDVSLLHETNPNQVTHFIVSNDKKGILQMLQRIEKQKISLLDVLICFEDTGVYSMPLSCMLSEKQFDYWMIPAIEIKRSKGISRGKNDKSDSRDIAFYALTHLHKLRLSKIAANDLLKLKLLITERDKVMKAKRILESTHENEGFIPKEVMQSVKKINEQAIAQLEKTIAKLDEKMLEIVNSNQNIKEQFKLINSIPGVGPQTAMYMIVTTKGFTTFDNWRQMACYAGVAPFEYSSGSSIKGRTKVNHLADKKLKSLLNLCALNSKKHDKQIAEYYVKKVAEGKSKMLVINNIRCKLISRIFAVINRGTPYINTFKFAA